MVFSLQDHAAYQLEIGIVHISVRQEERLRIVQEQELAGLGIVEIMRATDVRTIR